MRRRRTPPPRLCDAPGCTRTVSRGMLMCRPHWYALPRQLAHAIGAAWKEGRIRDWSAHCLEARNFLATAEPAPPRVSSEEAYARTARMMGER